LAIFFVLRFFVLLISFLFFFVDLPLADLFIFMASLF